MARYAERADMEAHVEGWVTDNPEALNRLLERASRDLDSLFAHLPVITTGDYAGHRFDPADLDAWEVDALKRAAVYQAEYRFHRGELELAGAGASVIEEQGPDFRRRYADQGAPGYGNRYSPRLVEPLGVLARFRTRPARARP